MSTNIRGEYGQSEHGNFKVIDAIGVPHPFCIGTKHVEIASDQFGGCLGEAAIEAAEKQGYGCQMRFKDGGKCQLSYKEHETALLVGCLKELKGEDGNADPELHAYLLKIKDECEKNKYAGFAFKRGF